MINISVIAVLTASLLGSIHCVGMCGGFVIYNTANSKYKIIANILYNLGRLTTYCILGFFAGLFGYALNESSIFIGISHLASLSIGIILIIWGIKSFIKNDINKVNFNNRSFFSKFVSNFYSSILKNKYSLSAINRAFILGLISTLLPCGWLYSFVAIAAASEDPLVGTFIMLLFWIGTVPYLLGTALFSKITILPLQRFVPRIMAILIIVAGFFSILSHYQLLSFGIHH